MTVEQLIEKLTELGKPGYTVDARYTWSSIDEQGNALPDCYVDDLLTLDLTDDGYVTLLLGDPS